MYHVFFIHSSFDGHLVCVHVLAIVNTAPGGLLDPGIEPRSPALQAEALTSEPVGQTPSEHWGACIFWNYGFLWVYVQGWDCWVIFLVF